jgi:hypothetical protein
LDARGAKTLYIEPGSPWENGHCESFNSKLRDEFLNGEIFYSMKKLRVLAERWRVHFNTVRPHSPLGYRSPTSAAWQTEATLGHGKVESKKRFYFPTPTTTAAGPIHHPLRYTNNLAATKNRADQKGIVDQPCGADCTHWSFCQGRCAYFESLSFCYQTS